MRAVSDGRVLGAQVGGELIDDVLIAARFELRVNDFAGVLLGGVRQEPENAAPPTVPTADCGGQ